MKILSLPLAACLIGTVAQAQLIDDFSANLSAYTATRILNNGNHSPANTYSWEINNGALRINTTAYVGTEQFALTRTDFSLGVGSELTATFAPGYTGVQDIGLYVGAGTPTQDVRQNYVNVYVRDTGQLFSRGFNGNSEFPLSGGSVPANITSLFIARTTTDTFQLGYYDGTIRNVLTTRTIGSGNAAGVGSSIGFYADVRSTGLVGNMDNLTITAIPEPAAGALLGVGMLALAFRVRRK